MADRNITELQLQGYRTIRPLGTGGWGSVWLAEDLRDHTTWAVKREQNSPNNQREARILSELSCPAFPSLHEIRVEGDNLYIIMEYIDGLWETSATIGSLGWLAVALVIFATWKPMRCIWGAYLFGLLSWFYFLVPGLFKGSDKIFQMLPYLFTLLVLILVSLRRKPEDQPPASLGKAYFREDR